MLCHIVHDQTRRTTARLPYRISPPSLAQAPKAATFAVRARDVWFPIFGLWEGTVGHEEGRCEAASSAAVGVGCMRVCATDRPLARAAATTAVKSWPACISGWTTALKKWTNSMNDKVRGAGGCSQPSGAHVERAT